MIWRLAYRNLWRNKRRTLLTLTAMVLSCALLVFILALSEGMLADLLMTATRQYTGQAIICTEEYRRDKDFFAYLADPARLLERARSHPRITGASARLRAFGLMSHEGQTVAGELLGVDWDAESTVTTLKNSVVHGAYPRDPKSAAMLIGSGMAEKLRVAVKDEVVAVTQAADGSIGNELFVVAGIFKTGDFSRDNFLALTGSQRLGAMLALEGPVHEIALAMERPDDAPLVAASLRPGIEELQPGVRVLPWQAVLPLMAQMRDIFDSSMLITTIILYAAAGMVVVNTILMAFYERLREFGLLMALGMTPGRIRLLLLAEGLTLGCLASFVGSLLGVLVCLALSGDGLDLSAVMQPVSFGGGSFLPVLRTELYPRDILIPAGGLILMTMAAVALPAWRGGRLQPAQDIQRASQ